MTVDCLRLHSLQNWCTSYLVFSDFDTSVMRSHLLTCFESGVIKRFALRKVRRCPVGSKVRKGITELIYCSCRVPNDKRLSMIQCDN